MSYLHVVVGGEKSSQPQVRRAYLPDPPRHPRRAERRIRELMARQKIRRPQPLLILGPKINDNKQKKLT